MRCVRTPAAAAAFVMLSAAVGSASSAHADILITISKAEQRVAVDVDGSARYRWPVSTGRRGYSTPSGSFRPIRLERSWYSRKYDWAPMPHSIFFYKGYAMHGTLEERRLGRPASHGCVRLSRANAATLFALLREHGKTSARIEVIDGRLPAPLPAPLADPRMNIAEIKATLRSESKEAPAKPETKADAKPEVKDAAEPAPVIKVAAKPEADVPLPRTVTRVVKADVAALPPKARIIAVTQRPAPAQISTQVPAKVEIVRGGAFTAVGDDAAVMRGREAWLRSLDRKYGITR